MGSSPSRRKQGPGSPALGGAAAEDRQQSPGGQREQSRDEDAPRKGRRSDAARLNISEIRSSKDDIMDTFNPHKSLGTKKGSKLNLTVDTKSESHDSTGSMGSTPRSAALQTPLGSASARQPIKEVATMGNVSSSPKVKGDLGRPNHSPKGEHFQIPPPSPKSASTPSRTGRLLGKADPVPMSPNKSSPGKLGKKSEDSPTSLSKTPNRASKKLASPPKGNLEDDDFDSQQRIMTPKRSVKSMKIPAGTKNEDNFEFSNPLTDAMPHRPLQRGPSDSSSSSQQASPPRSNPGGLKSPTAAAAAATSAAEVDKPPILPPPRAFPSGEPPPSPSHDRPISSPKTGFSPILSSMQAELLARVKSLPSDRGKALVDADGTLKTAEPKKQKSMLLSAAERLLAERASEFKSVSDVSLMMNLSDAEEAFMPGDLVRRLGESAGQLPPTPSVFVGSGAILFVDVSGFTKLSETLRAKMVPVQAAEMLASTIRKVLETLALACLDNGGDVAKFAGDALLCVWDNEELEVAEASARRAAVDMLVKLKELNDKEKTDLQIHGGIARGSVLHFHLGSLDDDLRTYIIAGEAVTAATQLVDVALPGEFCVLVNEAKGLPTLADDDALLKHAEAANSEEGMFSSARRSIVHDFGPSVLSGPKRKALANTEGRALRTEFINAATVLPAPPPPSAQSRLDAAVIRGGLPKECNVYVPTALRGKLDFWEQRTEKSLKDAFRRRVGILFCELEDLRLTEDELLKRQVPDEKLKALDGSYINMTRITQAFGGEVRDMLFDDKGCIFIAVFGAHTEDEIDSDNRWINGAVRTAMAINREVPTARMGVTVGTCFVGMVGPTGRRTDFCVIGNDVNMAARYMAAAQPGQIYVSSAIKQFSEGIDYGVPVTISIGKKDRVKKHTVYSPLSEQSATPEFRSLYRSKMRNPGTFVGRANELDTVRGIVSNVERSGKSCVVLLQGAPGMGKRSLCKRIKGMGFGRIKVASGEAFQTERFKKHFTLQKVIEAYTGIRPAMSQEEISLAIAKLESGRSTVDKINKAALASLLPWVDLGIVGGPPEVPVKAVAACILTLIRLAHTPHGRAVAPRATMLVLEECQLLDAHSAHVVEALLEGLPQNPGIVVLLSFATNASDGSLEALVDGDDTKVAAAAEKARREVAKGLRDRARSLASTQSITLAPLVESAHDLLAARLLKQEVDSETLEKLFQATQGDPLHLMQLVAWLKEKQLVPHARDQAVVGALHVKESVDAFPRTTSNLVKARVNLLPSKVQTVVQVATTGGEVFDGKYILDCCRVLEELDGTLVDAKAVHHSLNLLGEIGLAVRLGKNKDPMQERWAFTHEAVRLAILSMLDGARVAALNKRAKDIREDLWERLTSFVVVESDAA